MNRAVSNSVRIIVGNYLTAGMADSCAAIAEEFSFIHKSIVSVNNLTTGLTADKMVIEFINGHGDSENDISVVVSFIA